MTKFEQLEQEAKQMQGYLEIECSDSPVEVLERIKTLSVYMARSGSMLAEAKRMYQFRVSSEITETIIAIAKEEYLSASAQNALVKSLAKDEAYLVELLDNINRTCVHQIEALRSILSYEKESMRLNNTGY